MHRGARGGGIKNLGGGGGGGGAAPRRRGEGGGWGSHRIPHSYKRGMRVPGLVFADDTLLPGIKSDNALEQVANVAFLPGILRASMAMPDIHWGYGFPVGGVAAVDFDEGAISPGGIGFGTNSGG